MKNGKTIVMTFFLVCTLLIPTSAFATYGHTYNDQGFFESIFSFISKGHEEKKSWGKEWDKDWKDWDKDDWHDDDWKDWDKDKDKWGHWDGCKKSKNRCIESKDIWKDWYGGKDKDRDDDHDNGWGNNDWDYKKDYSWNDDKKNQWFSWLW